jgi:hypothetical protein
VLRALKKAERTAAREGVELSTWEGEFLMDVADRVKTYGRAFADPDKGDPGQALSQRQALKLRQITSKAKGESPFPGRAKRFGRKPDKRPASGGEPTDED